LSITQFCKNLIKFNALKLFHISTLKDSCRNREVLCKIIQPTFISKIQSFRSIFPREEIRAGAEMKISKFRDAQKRDLEKHKGRTS